MSMVVGGVRATRYCCWVVSDLCLAQKKQKIRDTFLPRQTHVCVEDTSDTSTCRSFVASMVPRI